MKSYQILSINNDIFDCVLSKVLLAKETIPLSKGVVASLQSFYFVDGEAGPLRYDIQRNTIITETFSHGLFLFQSLGLGFGPSFSFSFFLAFIKFVFKSHVLVPYESVGFEKRHLFIDSFRFVGVHISCCKVLHVSLHDRVCKILVPREYIKIFLGKVAQGNLRCFLCPVFKVVNGESSFENVYWAQKDDVLGLEAGVKVSLGKSDPVANALVIPSTLRQFFGVDHLHFQIKRADGFSFFVSFFCKNIKANALVICVETENGLWSGRFQVVNFYVKQMLDEGLGDVLVAENEPEHNRIGNVEFVKGLYCHLYSLIIALGDFNIHLQRIEKYFPANFANNRYHKSSFCSQRFASLF